MKCKWWWSINKKLKNKQNDEIAEFGPILNSCTHWCKKYSRRARTITVGGGRSKATAAVGWPRRQSRLCQAAHRLPPVEQCHFDLLRRCHFRQRYRSPSNLCLIRNASILRLTTSKISRKRSTALTSDAPFLRAPSSAFARIPRLTSPREADRGYATWIQPPALPYRRPTTGCFFGIGVYFERCSRCSRAWAVSFLPLLLLAGDLLRQTTVLVGIG